MRLWCHIDSSLSTLREAGTLTAMRCELCHRPVQRLTVHHLVPKQEEGTDGPTAGLCSACHRQIHVLFDNKTLARELASVEELRAHPGLAKFIRWVRRQDPAKRVKVRRARRR